MQHNVSLNDLYRDFLAGLLGKKELEGAVFMSILSDIRCLPGFSQQEQEDYISWLYPRIRRAITTYEETGASFETYIGTMVRLTAKEFRQRQARNYTAEATAWIAQYPDLYAYEHEPEYDKGSSASASEGPSQRKNPRQLLILVLKCCNYVSDDFLEKVSLRLEITPEVLTEMISHLKVQRVKREREIGLLRERASSQFFRCIYYEQSLHSMPDDCAAARKLREKLKLGRKRLAKIRKRLARLRPDPSNRQIAKMLGISKGAVDAALSVLRARWNKDQDQDILN